MQYRFSKNRPEIVKTLAERLTANCLLTVWQKHADGTRSFLEKMSFHELFPEEGVFTLTATEKNSVKFDPSKEVYFLLEEKDFVFKTKMAVDQKEFLTLQIPREVRLKEFRMHERTYFSLEDRKIVNVIFGAKNNSSEMTLSCPLVNISEGGACIVVTKETISNIDFSADILFQYTNDFQKAVIRNARLFLKRNLNNDELYSIGLQFK